MNKWKKSEWIWIAGFKNEYMNELTNECKDDLTNRWVNEIMPR